MKSIFENPISSGGANMNLDKMIHEGCLAAAFPLHDHDFLIDLQDDWLVLWQWPNSQPFLKIRNYFGEKLALFYVFLGHYTASLGWPSLIGIGIYVVQKLLQNQKGEHIAMPCFAVYMCVWSTVFIELWKGKQARYAMEWGVWGFEDEEQDRPTFEGYQIKSPIDGEDYTYFPREDADCRKRTVNIIILMCILGVVCSVIAVFTFQIWSIQNKEIFTVAGFELAQPLGGGLNAFVIIILNAAYTGVAIRMNDYENHRTETMYEDNLIAKIFVFQIVNSYASLTYISFFKSQVAECLDNSCTQEVSNTLSTLFLSRLLTANITGIVLPKIALRKRMQEESEGLEPGVEPTPIETEYSLEAYNITTTLLTEYAQLVIQFGYVILFVATFPLAPLMAFVSNYVAIRIGCWRLCQIYRRPEPRSAEDIGTWCDMLEIMSLLSVMYNLGLILFTGEYFLHYTWIQRWFFFLVAEHFAFLAKYVVSVIIPDVPSDVEMQIERQKFLVGKVIEDKADDDDGELDQTTNSRNAMIISDTDGDWEYHQEEDDEVSGIQLEQKRSESSLTKT